MTGHKLPWYVWVIAAPVLAVVVAKEKAQALVKKIKDKKAK